MARGNAIYVPYGYRDQPILNPKDDSCKCDVEGQHKTDQSQDNQIKELQDLLNSKLDVSAFSGYSGSVQTTLDNLQESLGNSTSDLLDKYKDLSGKVETNTGDIIYISGITDDIIEELNAFIEQTNASLSGKSDSTFVNEEISKLKDDISENTEKINEFNNALSGVTGNLSDIIESINDKLDEKVDNTDFNNLSEIVNALSASTEVISGTIPTKVSQLENDVPYLTEHQSLEDYLKKDQLENCLKEYHDKTVNPFIEKTCETLETLDTSIKGLTPRVESLEEKVVNLEEDKVSRNEFETLVDSVADYNTALDEMDKKVVGECQTLKDFVNTKVHGVETQLNGKVDKVDYEVLKQKVADNEKAHNALDRFVKEDVLLEISNAKSTENQHYQDVLDRISEESNMREQEDSNILSKLEEEKQTLIQRIDTRDTDLLDEAKAYTDSAKSELNSGINAINTELTNKFDNYYTKNDTYSKIEVDDKVANTTSVLDGNISATRQELLNTIEKKEEQYDRNYGEKISDNTSLINQIRDEYNVTKEECHALYILLFGPDGKPTVERLEKLSELLDTIENIVTTDTVKKEVEKQIDKKCLFIKDDDGNSIVKDSQGNNVFEVSSDGIFKLNIEGEMMNMNELLGQLAHETYETTY